MEAIKGFSLLDIAAIEKCADSWDGHFKRESMCVVQWQNVHTTRDRRTSPSGTKQRKDREKQRIHQQHGMQGVRVPRDNSEALAIFLGVVSTALPVPAKKTLVYSLRRKIAAE